jgi:integrase
MARLTEQKLRSLKPRDKVYRVADSDGLCIEVHPSGARYWRYRYRFVGKAKMQSLGVYPEVTLAEAREALQGARKALRGGEDPIQQRQRDEQARRIAGANTFEAVAREWLQQQEKRLATTTYDKAEWMLEQFAFPWVGARPISEIDAPEMLALLRRIEERGKLETAHRVKQRCSQIFRYAIATGRATRDPCPDLRGALASPKTEHHASITDPNELGHLLKALDGYKGNLVTAAALRLAPLVFVRPGELRHAEWAEFDLEEAQWRIPGAKMKMGETHLVPLSQQAVAILRELQPLTGKGRYVFPGVRSSARPMSENTVLAALRRLGYTNDQMTGHGFRSTASTRLHEMGWNSQVIERQLAHAERNKVKAAYNYAEYLPERRRMMQAWADYLDGLKSSKVVQGNFGRVA